MISMLMPRPEKKVVGSILVKKCLLSGFRTGIGAGSCVTEGIFLGWTGLLSRTLWNKAWWIRDWFVKIVCDLKINWIISFLLEEVEGRCYDDCIGLSNSDLVKFMTLE